MLAVLGPAHFVELDEAELLGQVQEVGQKYSKMPLERSIFCYRNLEMEVVLEGLDQWMTLGVQMDYRRT